MGGSMVEAKRRKHPITDGNDDDKISNLPLPIHHQILSLLPPVDVIRTCVLSKTFHSALHSFPVINLDYSWFKAAPLRPEVTGNFLSYVDNSIQRLKLDNTSLHKFTIRAQITDREQAGRVMKAVKFAIRNRVEELDIDLVLIRPIHRRYSLPLTIIRSAKSLVTLNLAGSKVSNFNGLDMSSCCPLLENICISCCTGLKQFNFSSTKIRSIVLQYCYGLKGVKIQSRSLQNFRCANLCEFCEIDISECRFLKALSLDEVGFKTDWVEDNVPKLVHLEDFELISSCAHKGVVICSESLKKLVLLRLSGDIEIRAPKLEAVGLISGKCQFSIHPCMHHNHLSWKEYCNFDLTVNALRDKVSNMVGFDRLKLTFDRDCKLNRFEIVRHKKSSGSSTAIDKIIEVKILFKVPSRIPINHSLLPKEILNFNGRPLDVTLSIDSDRPLDMFSWVIFSQWIETFGRVRSLTLTCSTIQDLVFPECLTKNLHPRMDYIETMHFISTGSNKRSLEFVYGSRVGAKGDLTRCRTLSMKCWKHSLTKVVLKNFDCAQRDNLVKYFPKNALVLNTIDCKGSSSTSDISTGELNEIDDNQRCRDCYQDGPEMRKRRSCEFCKKIREARQHT